MRLGHPGVAENKPMPEQVHLEAPVAMVISVWQLV